MQLPLDVIRLVVAVLVAGVQRGHQLVGAELGRARQAQDELPGAAGQKELLQRGQEQQQRGSQQVKHTRGSNVPNGFYHA